jgi:hypothetical protein
MLEGVVKQDFSEKGAPLINRYRSFGEEGYGYVYVTNDEKEATFIEKV